MTEIKNLQQYTNISSGAERRRVNHKRKQSAQVPLSSSNHTSYHHILRDFDREVLMRKLSSKKSIGNLFEPSLKHTLDSDDESISASSDHLVFMQQSEEEESKEHTH